MEKLKNFKIKVTLEQSKIVQETLFKEGIKWASGVQTIQYLDSFSLVIEKDKIRAFPEMDYNNCISPEITFKDFHRMYIYDITDISMKDCIEKKDVSPFFKNIEDMKEALNDDTYGCYFIQNKYYKPYNIDDDLLRNCDGVNCDGVSCNDCPFHKCNKNLLKEMLPQLKEKNQTINGKKEGYWEEYDNNGKLMYKGNYKNGKMEGYWEEYWNNGKLMEKGNYKDGEREGLWEYYHVNGNLYSKGNYKDGKSDGLWEFYYYNGKLMSKGNYKEGREDGLWEFYYYNGKLRYKGNYKEGKQDGYWEEYDNNGKLMYKENYKNGKFIK